LEAHLASITEVFVADGAADEQLAGRMLHGSRAASGGKQLPNLRLVARDKPHSARRLLQRTLPADPFIRQLMTALLWSRGSLARLVQHSPHWRDKFRHHQLRFSGGPTVKDLAYSKQRFDSTARPLGRMIDHFDAFLAIAADIMNERRPSTQEHKRANGALNILDTESMLQLGMVADASEAVVRFIRFLDIRFLDNARFETAELQHQINALTTTATELFCDRGCLTYDGFTKKMIALICRPRLVTLSDGKPKTLGDDRGPSEAIVARCLGRMVNWWRLASSVLETEFPDWDLLLRFHAFRVPRDLSIQSQTRDQLLGLCATFGADPGRVLPEFETLSPVATQLANQIAAIKASDVPCKPGNEPPNTWETQPGRNQSCGNSCSVSLRTLAPRAVWNRHSVNAWPSFGTCATSPCTVCKGYWCSQAPVANRTRMIWPCARGRAGYGPRTLQLLGTGAGSPSFLQSTFGKYRIRKWRTKLKQPLVVEERWLSPVC